MLDKFTIKAPAKINLFLHILNKREDGYHNIKSGITFINLYDEVNIKKSNKMSIKYYGDFRPTKGLYTNCIIKKTFNFLDLNKKVNLAISVKKNIPVQAGLGSASTNAVAVMQGLEKLNIIKIVKDYKFYASIGADIPAFLFGKNLLAEGIGEKISNNFYPKYYFLLVKPNINFSTKEMYNKIGINQFIDYQKNNIVHEDEQRNDFEKIAINESKEISDLLSFLSKSEKCMFAQMSGSGSCCYASYERLEYATLARIKLKLHFPNLWSFICENNLAKK